MKSEYVFKNYHSGDEIMIELDSEEQNTDLRDEMAYNLLIEGLKDDFYIDEVFDFC